MKEKVFVTNVTSTEIVFSDGTQLESEHESSCCESHYLDFSTLELKDFEGLEFDLSSDDFFNKIEDYGIELVPLQGWPVKIAGYGYNNGYYSTTLTLVITKNGKAISSYDITECQVISG